MHTAEQAVTLWCPMVRTPKAIGDTDESPLTATNTGIRGDRAQRVHQCVADKCAMWRWAGGRQGAWNVSSGVAPPPMVKTEYGYCGLASRPEVG